MTGTTVGTCAAHIVARSCAEGFGVPVEQIDSPGNMITLSRELELSYDRFEWSFDERGAIHVLYRHSPIIALVRVHLVPESAGGPNSRFMIIRIAHEIALIQAKNRCQECWEVRV